MVNCGSGVNVWWDPSDLPVASSYRLCINGSCEFVRPYRVGDGYLTVAPRSGTAEKDVAVSFELVDDLNGRLAMFEGTGSKGGGCCPGVELGVELDGDLVEERL